jgi:hypothetical protein
MRPLTMLLGITVMLLVFMQVEGMAQEKYLPTADEEIYGAWTNEDHLPQEIVNSPEGYKAYNFKTDSTPIEEGSLSIDSKWMDSEGNIWYRRFGAVTFGTYKGTTFQTLDKLSKSGTVWEEVLALGEFDPNRYPTRLNPRAESYSIYYRAEK